MRSATRHPLSLAIATALAVACSSHPSPLLESVSLTPRGHHELSLGGPLAPMPVVIGRDGTIGLCLDVPAQVDTSQWEASLTLSRSPGPVFAPPAARLATTACFDFELPDDLPSGSHELCLTLRDRFDGRTASPACVPFELREADAAYGELRAAMARHMTSAADPDEVLAAFESLEREAEAHGLPLLALRLRLIGAYRLRQLGDAPGWRRAAERLASTPAWLEDPAASGWAAQLAYERASLALQAGFDLERAWQQLRQAEQRYRRIADAKLLTVVMKQSEILARVGAVAEARGRLALALDQCGKTPCDERLVPAAENTLAWLTLLDPDAAERDLARAEGILDRIAATEPSADRLERANVWVNLAYVRALRGGDASGAIVQARATANGASTRERLLDSWLDMVEALAARDAGRTAEALERCHAAATAAEDPRLAAAALSCVAEIHRAAGDAGAAADAFERALVLHEYATPRVLGQSVPLGPSHRADAYYRAARNEVERGSPHEAWALLADLDGLGATEAPVGGCGARPDTVAGRQREEWVRQLASLELPASATRREERQAIKRTLLEKLQELERSDPACVEAGRSAKDTELDFRAFPLDDEILLLRQHPSGRVELYRRTPLVRARLLEWTSEIEKRLAERDPDDRSWSDALAALAPALVPDADDLGEVTSFALYGALQRVPLAALPLDATETAGRRLADATVVVHRPAGAASRTEALEPSPRRPLFVVDPTGDLAGARDLAGLYERWFAGANVLVGKDATAEAFRRGLPSAEWLHVDAHVHYDPAFPELSTLRLADGGVSPFDLRLVTPHLGFANLSACRSGDAPVTADSGRYGLAGWLSRQGVRWVVGSRADLADDLARDFNTGFYRSLASGEDVPFAYREAFDRVRRAHPVSSWAALLLLEGAPAEAGGRSAVLRTPPWAGRVHDGPPGAEGVP